MQVHLDVPEDVARQFAAEPGGVARAALEALAAGGVRSGKLTAYQARRMLGIPSRCEMDAFSTRDQRDPVLELAGATEKRRVVAIGAFPVSAGHTPSHESPRFPSSLHSS